MISRASLLDGSRVDEKEENKGSRIGEKETCSKWYPVSSEIDSFFTKRSLKKIARYPCQNMFGSMSMFEDIKNEFKRVILET